MIKVNKTNFTEHFSLVPKEIFVDKFLSLDYNNMENYFNKIKKITDPIIAEPIKKFADNGILTNNAFGLISIGLNLDLGYEAFEKSTAQTAHYEYHKRYNIQNNLSKYGDATDLQVFNKSASQLGLNILHSGDTIHKNGEEYLLGTKLPFYVVLNEGQLTTIHPTFKDNRKTDYNKSEINDIFITMKIGRNNCCWCCGAKEGEINDQTGQVTPILQRGHRYSVLPICPKNIIPLCSHCNGPFKDSYDFSLSGDRIEKICNKQEAYKLLLDNK